MVNSVLRRLGVLTTVVAVFVLPAAPAAHAVPLAGGDSAQKARAAAARSAAKVKTLQNQLEKALTAYDAALNGLQQQISAGIDLQDSVTANDAAAQAAEDARTERVRAIYMGGGPMGVYASLLTSQSPQDLALRVMSAQRVVAEADVDVTQSAGVAAQTAEQQTASNQQISAAVVSADDVTVLADRVSGLVRQERGQLAHLSATARALTRKQLAAAAASADGAARSAAGQAAAMAIPPAYLALYRSAALTCPGMPWTLLAAVGQVESGHGRNNGPSSAGAVGPMQFRPRTFDAYAVDGNHDGHLDPWNPADAIFTAAHFLCVGGAGSPAGVQRALLRYNNAQWYVDLVLGVQQRITAAY